MEGQQIEALVQLPDLMPTILEMTGLVATESIGGQAKAKALQCGVFVTEDWQFNPEQVHGKSLMPLMRGQTDRHREFVVSSNTLIHHTPIVAKSAIVTEEGWCLHYAGRYDQISRGGKFWLLSLLDPEHARLSTEPALYYLPEDPQELHNVIDSNEALAQEIHQRYLTWLEALNTPEEHLAGRRRLR
jgi:arylsulfatase A-like enzyme